MSHPTSPRLPVALVMAAGIVFHLGPAANGGGTGLSLATPALAAEADAAASPEGPVKTRRTYYTPQRLEAGREGFALAVPAADRYLERHTLEEHWNWMTGQELPRAMGVRADGSSHRPDEAEPWRVEVEIDGGNYRMPTNDFWAYHESGLDERGFFDPEKADRSLLVNELYPEKGYDWGVDDGFGWQDENGTYWTFVAYYNHWYGLIEVRRRITTFRDAYLHTGDPEYARAGLILLDRVADIYPEMDTSAHIDPDIPRNRRPFRNSNGGTDQGRLVGSIWETNHIRHIVAAYDAFFPLIREGDEELIEFLSRKADKYPGLEGKESTEAIARNIENNIIREVLPAVKKAQIRGNFGMHQSALAMAAVVLDEPDGYSADAIEFIFRAGGLTRTDGEWRVTGGEILHGLVDEVDRDGYGHESAPNYNLIHRGHVRRIGDILAEYDRYDGINLAEYPKYVKMVHAMDNIYVLDRYRIDVGNSGNAGGPDNRPDSPVESIQEAGYGMTVLRDGERLEDWPDNRRALWIYHGRNFHREPERRGTGSSHAAPDSLQIGYFGFGLDMAPPLGYATQTGAFPQRNHWLKNTISHNTVVMNRRSQEPSWVGVPRHFDADDTIQLVDVEAPNAYPDAELYRRTSALVRVDEENSYVVDFFRAFGGEDHVFSFHGGAHRGVTTDALDLTVQARGTYAGEDVERPEPAENTAYNREVGNGFNYLHNVERAARPAGGFSVEWKLLDFWEVLPGEGDADLRLRLTLLNDDLDEAALADGPLPRGRGNPDTFKYLLAHRQGEDLKTVFTSVIEPYRDERFIAGIRAVEVTGEDGRPAPESDVRAVRVELADGRVDYLATALDKETMYRVDELFEFQGFFAHYRSDGDERPLEAYLHDGSTMALATGGPLIESRTARLEGRVIDFTREMRMENHLLVEAEGISRHAGELPGRWVYVENDNWRNGAYEIVAVEPEGGDRAKLHLGNTTLIRRFRDPENFDAGYVYNLDEGAAFYIPLSKSRSRGR